MNKFWDDNELDSLNETTNSSEKIFDGELLHVHRDMAGLSNGSQSVREYITHPGASCVVPLTDDNKVVVERQFRYPLQKVLTELPAGKRDPGEDFLTAAKRELLEETGLEADEWTDMGPFIPCCAYSTEHIQLFLARGLHFGKQHLDADEFVDLYQVPFDDLLADVISGEIVDGKTQAALLKAAHICQIGK